MVLPLLLGVVGCGTEPERKVPTPTALQPANDTPQHAIQRLVAAYEQKQAPEYRDLFTGDFRFEFSTAADPTLAQKYHDGWLKGDEDTSALHLFRGFTDDSTGYHPAASSIDLTFPNTTPIGDTASGDSIRYKVLATRVDGVIVVSGQTEDVRYVIDNNFLRFYLVRGDAAVGLDAEQPADDAHWYVYRWVDETAMPAAPGRTPSATVPTTWARVKALYR
jgi:hypothetical protein